MLIRVARRAESRVFSMNLPRIIRVGLALDFRETTARHEYNLWERQSI